MRIAATLGLTLGGLFMLTDVINGWKEQGLGGATRLWLRGVSGYDLEDGAWKLADAHSTLAMGLGMGVSKVASKLHLNSMTPKGVNI